jgi:hypothetical protein
MTDLTAFAALPLDQLTAELDRMLANHHARDILAWYDPKH